MQTYYQHVRNKHNGKVLPGAPKINLSKNRNNKKLENKDPRNQT